MNTQTSAPTQNQVGAKQGERQKTFVPNRKKTFNKQSNPISRAQGNSKVKISFLGGIGGNSISA